MSDTIKAQYQTLSELRRVDERVSRLRIDIEQLPKEIAKLDEALGQRTQQLQAHRDQFGEAEKALRRLEQELKEKEDHLHKAESKMMEVKTNEEYQAALKENEGQKLDKSKLEDRALTLMNQVEEHRKKLREIDGEFKTYEKGTLADKTRLAEERTKLVNLLEERLQERAVFAKNLSGEVLELYERATSRIKNIGIAKAINGLCDGCNMRLRPQLFNEVIGFQVIHRCPSCGRLLIPTDFGDTQEPA